MSKREFRFLAKAEVRAKSDGSAKTITGYAAMFNSPSQDLGGFVEVIRPGAFTKSLASNPDVRCLFNHEADMVLGRSTSGTLRLFEDEVGLRYECDLGDQSYATDLHISITRGDVDESSFGFYCKADNWLPTTEAPGVLREVLEADVFDVSPVTFPAYKATSVNARTMFPDGVPSAVKEEHGDTLRRQKITAVLSEIAAEEKAAVTDEADRDVARLRIAVAKL